MTAIAYRNGIMAADSVGWTCESVKMATHPKIRRTLDGGVFACAGSSAEIVRFADWMLSTGDLPTDFERDDQFNAIWVKPDRTLWHCNHRISFYQVVAPFFVIGAPSVFMLGAMYAGATAEEAVCLAILHTDGAGGEVQVERVGIRG